MFCNAELCSAEWEPSLGLCVAVGVVRSVVHIPATGFAGGSTADRTTASSVRQRGHSAQLTQQNKAWTVYDNLRFKFPVVEAMLNDVFWNEAFYLLKFTGVWEECVGLYFRI